MHPLIDSPAGIAATESYLNTIPFSAPKITHKSHSDNYAIPMYKRGHAFAYIMPLSGAKRFNAASSPIKGKFMISPMPGTMVGKTLVRRTSFIYGNNIVIAKNSPQQELAFLFAMWFTDPDISERAINVLSGFADPFRRNHITAPSVRQIYTQQALDQLESQVDLAVPAGTGLPGDAEYIRALSENLWLAAQGKLSAREAMVKTAAQWEAITEKYGRQNQIEFWRSFKGKYPRLDLRAAGQ